MATRKVGTLHPVRVLDSLNNRTTGRNGMTEITKRCEKGLDLKRVLAVVGLAALLPCQGNAAVVFSQPASGAFLRQSSQIGCDRFSSDYDQYVWDNFTLSSNETITEIDWRGFYTSGGYYGGAVSDFVIGIYGSIAGGFQPDVLGPPLAEYTVGGNASETPPLTPGSVSQSMHDYTFVLSTPFVATAGTKYWVQIEAVQNGPTDWGLGAGTNGDNSCFIAQPGVGDFQYFKVPGDVAFTLLSAATPANTATPTAPLTTTATPTVTSTPSKCVGDCHGDGHVTVDEIIVMVNIALDITPIATCEAGNPNHDAAITVDEIIQAVNAALSTCA